MCLVLRAGLLLMGIFTVLSIHPTCWAVGGYVMYVMSGNLKHDRLQATLRIGGTRLGLAMVLLCEFVTARTA